MEVHASSFELTEKSYGVQFFAFISWKVVSAWWDALQMKDKKREIIVH
jgi:hypothetical protein